MPISISDLLAEARAYRFSLTLAHQHLSQLPKDLREAVSADARNKVYFTSSPEDAHDLARHVGPVLTAHDTGRQDAVRAASRAAFARPETTTAGRPKLRIPTDPRRAHEEDAL